MKLKFIEQQYQTDAVNSICNIFDGGTVKDSPFTVNATTVVGTEEKIGHGNKLSIDYERILKNVQDIQYRNNIKMSKELRNSKEPYNFTIEMETGTGKTYVYTKTILELNKLYGFTKFIIVVPGLAIKEGVKNSLEATREHFENKYDNVNYKFFVYDSKSMEQVSDFAISTDIQIMIINIDAFRKNFEESISSKNDKKSNLFNRPSEKLGGERPIDIIANTNPIIIIDEPQSVDNTEKSKAAIALLNPLCILRYSATHKEIFNLMYRLTPVDAYQQKLVKQIEVASILSKEASTLPYVKLIDTSKTENGFRCRIEIYVKNKKTGEISKKVVTAKTNDNIWELSNEVDYYANSKYIISNIVTDEKYIEFGFSDTDSSTSTIGIKTLHVGEIIGEIDSSAIKKAQIRQTIETHLDRELINYNKGLKIKVLSLFFIDEVSKYRNYESEDQKGVYAQWFEEEYSTLIKQDKYKVLLNSTEVNIKSEASEVHEGYFSKDGKGRFKNSSGNTKDDDTTYQLIVQNKEKLLGFEEPVRFIFSHSALKEGWDNPNVFQICTLVETKEVMTKRQKIGRGLRICVDQNGERVLDPACNTLTVIANESYKEFASSLQKELEADNFKFGIIESVSFTGLTIKQPNGEYYSLSQDESNEIFEYLKENQYITKSGKVTTKFYQDEHSNDFILPDRFESFSNNVCKQIKKLSGKLNIKDASKKVAVKANKNIILSDSFQNLWNRIKRKTRYSIQMNIDLLKQRAINAIRNMPKIDADRIDGEINKISIDKYGISSTQSQLKQYGEIQVTSYPDFIRRLQDATKLLRKTIIDIIINSGRLSDFYINPEEFIKQVSTILRTVKNDLLMQGITNNSEVCAVCYTPVNEYYEQNLIFNDDGLFGYEGSNVTDKLEKSAFDHVIYDSQIEMKFAEKAEASDKVLAYVKLPNTFKIDTPIGSYNPDWALVVKTEKGTEELYFVTETKGTDIIKNLTLSEQLKIGYGQLHFKSLDSGVTYKVTKDFDEFIKNK